MIYLQLFEKGPVRPDGCRQAAHGDLSPCLAVPAACWL